MKKILLGFAALAAVILIYMTTSGSVQATEALKTKVHQQVSTLQKNGFSIDEKKIEEKKEHYVLTISEPKKIAKYLAAQGMQVEKEELAALKGAKLAMDISYLKDTYSVLSADIYPLTLPDSVLNEAKPEDKKIIAQFQKMLDEKALLIHVDFNKMLSGFKGYMKDLNQTFEDEEKVTLVIQGMTFKGDIEKERVNHIRQEVAILSVITDDNFKVTAKKMRSDYALTGSGIYDVHSAYEADEITLLIKDADPVSIKGFKSTIENNVSNGLAESSIHSNIDTLSFTQMKLPYTFDAVDFSFNIKNLDVAAFEALQETDDDNTTEIQRLTQEILSKGIEMQIPNFSVRALTQDKKQLGGFTLNSSLKIAKDLDLQAVVNNPFAMLNAVDAHTKLVISKELFTLISKDPRAMIMTMMIPRVEENGKTVYTIELKNGKFTVNGTSF